MIFVTKGYWEASVHARWVTSPVNEAAEDIAKDAARVIRYLNEDLNEDK